jgi:hypothetical protein
MPDFDLNTLQPFIFILVGIVLLLMAVLKKATKANLKQSGLKTEGIVYGLERQTDSTSPISDSSNVKDKVIVRFVTNNEEWITGDIKQEFAAFFTGQYKEGQKLDVYYDPKNPSDLFVDTKQCEIIGKILFVIVGLASCLIGLYKLLNI